MFDNISDLFIEYHFLQGKYIDLMLKKPEYKNYNELQYMMFFPNNWTGNQNYEKKIELLKQAIEQNICVTQIPESLDFEEGVRHTR